MEDKDQFFYVKWQDAKGREYKVGILARINDIFYMMCHSSKNNEKSAYANGFNGIPSFETGKLYRSEIELFDFFKNRVTKKEEEELFDKLRESGAKLPTDSFSIEEIPSNKAEQYKKAILEMENNIANQRNKQIEDDETVPHM